MHATVDAIMTAQKHAMNTQANMLSAILIISNALACLHGYEALSSGQRMCNRHTT